MPADDPAVIEAIEHQLQKGEPFSDGELASIDVLAVVFPASLAGIERISGLQTLVILGYGGRSLDVLAGLGLGVLDVRVSSVDSLDVVTQLPQLRTLSVNNCAVEEIDVLADGEHIVDELDLTGNPLSDRAYNDVLPRLRERISESLVFSGEREWRLTRRLYAAGLPFDYYYHRRAGGYRLCRPGLAYTSAPDADHLRIEPDDLEAILDRNPSELLGMFPTYDR
ncbi:hypothetical protein [Actinoplanes sp. NPDC051851]|uniref:hypothetical protein n=1 Tax=Actinoplanes sp. NPDC051851 TaxID=3154753 RepID=UPI00341D02CE